MNLSGLDLDVENYSINEIKKLFKLDNEYTTDNIHEKVDLFINLVTQDESIKIGEKKKVVSFLNSLRVILLRHLNQSDGMFNDITDVQNLEISNKIVHQEQFNYKHGLNGNSNNGNSGNGNGNSGNGNSGNGNSGNGNSGNSDIQGGRGADNLKCKTGGEDDDDGDVRMIKYKRDLLNPIKHETITRCITIDTRFRDNYSTTMSTDFRCVMPERFTNVVSMQLTALEFPTSFLIFREDAHNNFFSYQVIDTGNISTIKTIKIPSGNYSHTELLSAVNDRISANGDNISVDVDITSLGSGTGKTMISNQDSQLINIFFDRDENGEPDETPIPLKFGWILGFRNNEYVGNKDYVSEGMYEDHGSRYIYLSIDDHNYNTYDTYISMYNSSTFNRNILARISLKTPAFHILNETGLHLVTEPRKYMGPVNINTLNIQMLDEFGRIINLNNMDYSFCISIECLYK